jgi:hypothetical protein
MIMKNITILLLLILGCSSLLIASEINEQSSGTTNIALPHSWTGAISNAWDLPGNWSPGSVPSPKDDIIITIGVTNDPIISKDHVVICRNATIQHCTDKSVNSTSKGFTITGGEIIIDGNMTILSNAVLIIGSDGALTVNGNLTIVAGGKLIIESGGSLITNRAVSGIAYIKREVSSGLRWHFLSSPVQSQAILNGSFAPLPANFSLSDSTCFDFYKFNSACDPLHWINLRNADRSLNTSDFGQIPQFDVKRGYLVAYNNCLPTTKTFIGTPNTGDYTFNLTVGIPSCSWDLLGNPFPSAFKWSDVLSKSNLSSGYYYVWNEAKTGGPGYEAFLDENHHTGGVNGNIPAMQGFFVKVNATVQSPEITVPNSARIHDNDLWLKNTTDTSPNRLKLTLSNSVNSDETFILFEQAGGIGVDWYDAEKMLSMNEQVPQVYSIAENDHKILINSLPEISKHVTIPIGIIVPFDGNYSMAISDLENFTHIPGIILEDLMTSNTQNLLHNPVYYFTASRDNENNRFLLHFFSSNENNATLDSDPISVNSYGKSLYISCSKGMQNGRIYLSNMLGQQMLNQSLTDQTLNEVKLNVNAGYYIVKVQTEEYVKTVKVLLK